MSTTPSTSAPKNRVRKLAAIGAAPLAILLAGGLVWQGTQAAFTATTRNSGSSWSTGQVLLTDDDEGRAGFNVSQMLPGQSGSKCVVVTSSSNVAGTVRTYTQNLATSPQKLEDYLKINIEMGTGGSFNDCTGFTPESAPVQAASLSYLAANSTNFETSSTSWTTAGTAGETKTYRASWAFDTTGLTQAQIDALQGAQTSVDIVWELRSNPS